MASSLVLRVGFRPCLVRPTGFLRSSFTLSRRRVVLGLAGIGVGACSVAPTHTLHCDDGKSYPVTVVPPSAPLLPPPPRSSVNAYELTFGTVCGLCAGVFVKKSARMVAFAFGGLFVVLQYLGSLKLVKVDWASMASRFENLFYTTDAVGHRHPPTVRSIWKWIVDFLTADFQPRASFVVGFALGLRVG